MAENTNTEREAFESALKSLAAKHGETLEARDFGRDSSGEYENGATEIAWALWSARASLSLPAAGQEPVAPPMDGEIALIEKALERAGISSLLNHGAASCVFTEGCCGVSQDQILAYTREIALHCAVALGAAPQPAVAAGWMPIETAPKGEKYRDGSNAYSEYILAWYPGALAPLRVRWWQADSGINNFLADGGYAVFPTVWQPLPPAPSTEGESNG